MQWVADPLVVLLIVSAEFHLLFFVSENLLLVLVLY